MSKANEAGRPDALRTVIADPAAGEAARHLVHKPNALDVPPHRYREFVSRIVDAYDSTIVRAYSKVRFTIININILHILSLCLRGKRNVLDIGCGFGLFGCYFSALYPEISYCGYDLDANRIEMAKRAAGRLGLANATFRCQDAREISLDQQYDAVMIIDLLHHLDDPSKRRLLDTCAEHLTRDGRLIVKEVTTHPFFKIAITWALDVLMTQGFEMWYWNEAKFHAAFQRHFNRVDTFPITDWLPYPHIVYLCENTWRAGEWPDAPSTAPGPGTHNAQVDSR